MKKLLALAFLLVLVAACSPETTTVPTAGETQEVVVAAQATALPTATLTPSPIFPRTARPTVTPTRNPAYSYAIRTATPTRTPVYTLTPAPTFQIAAVPQIVGPGMPLAGSGEPIAAANIFRLARVGQWGKGKIIDLAYAPDGGSFVVGSEAGLAVYATADLFATPRWIPFESPWVYDYFLFSSDGKTLQFATLVYNRSTFHSEWRYRAFDLATGKFFSSVPDMSWISHQNTDNSGSNDTEVVSMDGALKFVGGRTVMVDGETGYYYDTYFGEVYDSTGELLFTLHDDVPPVEFRDRSEPQGCDIYIVTFCGNVYESQVMSPYLAGFSSGNRYLAVIYQATYLSHSEWFSYIRLYDASSGALIRQVGGLQRPVVDFAFDPSGEYLVVAYLDGSIGYTEIASDNTIFDTHDFANYSAGMGYSSDGKYLIIRRANLIEVRLAQDGSLRGQYPMSSAALSPVEDLLALGYEDGQIKLQYIDSGETLHLLNEHTDEVYALAFSEDGRYLASSSQDCTLRLWEVETGRFLHYLERNIADPYGPDGDPSRVFMYDLVFVPGADQIVGFGSWGTVASWSEASGATKFFIESPELDSYQGLITLDPHFPEYFDVDLETRTFYINNTPYDLDTGALSGVAGQEYKPDPDTPGECAPIGPITADGKLMITRGYLNNEGKLCVLTTGSRTLVGIIDVIPVEYPYDDYLVWVYLSPDGRQLVTNTNRGVIYVYQIVP